MPEVLDYFREEGMGFLRYIYCKNFVLRNYFNYMLKIILMKKKGGLEYAAFWALSIEFSFSKFISINCLLFFKKI